MKKKLLFLPIFASILTGFSGINHKQKIEQKPVENTGIKVQNIGFNVSNAFGEEGKKTVSLTLSPGDAHVDLEWSINKGTDYVVLTPAPDKKSAEIFVKRYFAPAAVLTVVDNFSGMTATANVTSLGNFAFQTGTQHTADFTSNTSAVLLVDDLNGSKDYKTISEIDLENSTIAGRDNNLGIGKGYDLHPVDLYTTETSVKLTIRMRGSYKPLVTINGVETGKDLTLQDNPAPIAGGGSQFYATLATYTIALNAGENRIIIKDRKLTDPNVANSFQGFIKVVVGDAPSSLIIPDVTFYE